MTQTAKWREIDGPEGYPVLILFAETTQNTTHISHIPSLHPTNSPTNSPTILPITLNPTEVPTLRPIQQPTLIPTNKPTNTPTKLPTNSPTKLPTNAPTKQPTNTPMKHWDQAQSISKQKKKKDLSARMMNTSLLINHAIKDRIELFVLLSFDTLILNKFETQFILASKNNNHLSIIRQEFTAFPRAVRPSSSKTQFVSSRTDVAFDVICDFLNEFKHHTMNYEQMTDVLHSSINILLLLNQSIFESILVKLDKHKMQYAYCYTKTCFYGSKSAPNKMRRVPMSNSSVDFVLDFFMYTFQALFWEKWNEIMHILQHTEYGNSEKIHPIMKNGWDEYKQMAQQYIDEVFPCWIQRVKHYGQACDPHIVQFLNMFNAIKERMDIHKIIYDFRYDPNRNKNGTVVSFTLRSLFPDEFQFLHHLGYEPECIHSYDVKVKHSINIKKERRYIFSTQYAEHSINVKKDVQTTKSGKQKKKKKQLEYTRMNVSEVENAILEGEDTIRCYLVDGKNALLFERKLLDDRAHAQDVILIRNEFLLSNIDDYSKTRRVNDDNRRIRSIDHHIDLLFEVSGSFFDVGDSWLNDIMATICVMDNSVFDTIYNKLDAMYPNKTMSQITFIKYIKQLYNSSLSVKERQTPSILRLVNIKPDIEDVVFDNDAADMELSLFHVIMLYSLDMKIHAVVNKLQTSEWALMEQANNFNETIYEQINTYVDVTRDPHMTQDTREKRLYELQIVAMETLQEFVTWSRYIEIVNIVYEVKYIQNMLDKEALSRWNFSIPGLCWSVMYKLLWCGIQ